MALVTEAAINTGADRLADYVNESGKGEKGEGAGGKEATKTVPSQHLLDALAYDRLMIERIAIRKIGKAGPQIANPARSFQHVKSVAGFKN